VVAVNGGIGVMQLVDYSLWTAIDCVTLYHAINDVIYKGEMKRRG
jgi:hypothetical protein